MYFNRLALFHIFVEIYLENRGKFCLNLLMFLFCVCLLKYRLCLQTILSTLVCVKFPCQQNKQYGVREFCLNDLLI